MGLDVKNTIIKANTTGSFEFSDKICQYLIGFRGFRCLYPSGDHHIQKFSINLVSSGCSGKKLDIKPEMVMIDSSGHKLDSDSWVDVTVAAWLGTNDDLLFMSSLRNKGESLRLSGTPRLTQVALSGFDLQYPKDHHVRRIGATAGYNWDPAVCSAGITGSAEMFDDSGNIAQTNLLTGSLVGYCGEAENLFGQSFSDLKSGSHSISLAKIPDTVGVFLNHFSLQFNKDHHVKEMRASVDSASINGSAVKLSVTTCFKDNSGDTPDMNKTMSGFILAYTK